MNPLEESVLDALETHASDAPDGLTLHEVVNSRIRRRIRRRRAALAAGTCVVAAGAIGVALSVGGASDRVRPIQPAITTPAGTQGVSYLGVEVFVPSTWKIDATQCGTPIANTVVIEDGRPTLACAISHPKQGLTVVRITGIDTSLGAARAELATHQTVVDGSVARTGHGTPLGEPTAIDVVVLPTRGAVVSVESPDPAAAQQILASIRLVAR
jgi:hypothetical protein